MRLIHPYYLDPRTMDRTMNMDGWRYWRGMRFRFAAKSFSLSGSALPRGPACNWTLGDFNRVTTWRYHLLRAAP